MSANGVTVDLVHQFSKVSWTTVKDQAKHLWSLSNASVQRHTRGIRLYNSRLFGLFLLNSLTPDFAALLHSRIDQAYSSDGPLLFITMYNHIHQNHLAFVESIKNKIRLRILSEHNNDVASYLRFPQDNLRIITSTGDAPTTHNDLLPHIFMQLRNTTIPLFQQKVLQWQRSYMENTLIISPTSLITMADEESQILRHSNQWVETIDPSVVAMKALFQGNLTGTQTLFQQIQANLAKIAKSRDSSSDGASGHRYPDRPDWVFDAPTTKTEQSEYHGRIWHYCTQCGRNGKWVCMHTDATHRRRDHDLDEERSSKRKGFHHEDSHDRSRSRS